MPRYTSTLLIVIALAGCGQEAPPPPPAAAIVPTEVVVTPPALDLAAGSGVQLAAQSNDGAGQPIGGAPIIFSSDTPDVLQVSSVGYVSAPGPAGLGVVSVVSGPTRREVQVRVHPGDPAKLEAAGTPSQLGVVGEQSPGPIQVRVLDAYGNPVPGATVQFEATTAGSVLNPELATADAAGLAATSWTLGSVAGPQVVRAFLPNSTTLEIPVTAIPGPPETIKTNGATTPASAGSTVRATVVVQDRAGNPVPDVPVAWSVASGKARVLTPVSDTSASGIAETEVATAPAVELSSIVARLASRSDLSVTIPVASVAGPPSSIEIKTGDRQTAQAGSAVRLRPTVLVADANGNPVAGAVVTFAITAGNGTVDDPAQTTSADGLAAPGRWVLGNAGTNELSATATGVTRTVTFVAQARRAR